MINYRTMKPLNRLSLLLAFLLPVSTLFADPGSNSRPYFVRSANFFKLIHNNYKEEPVTYNMLPAATPATGAKVCACQILKVASNNEKLEYVAVFAEKTNYGELTNSFTVAISVLEKEKKLMKNQFYPKMKVVEKISVYSSCKTLAGQLRSVNGNLRVYEILDADILGSVYLTPGK